MQRHTLQSIVMLLVIATALSGCIPGYGYGRRPGYYGGRYSGYSYRTTTFRPIGGGPCRRW